MREKFTRNIFLIVRLSYIRATVSRSVRHPALPSSLSPFPVLVLRVFPFLLRYLFETRKRPIRLTYVVARLLLPRSLQSQFGQSYSRVRSFMTTSVKYTAKDRRIRERLTGSETQEKIVSCPAAVKTSFRRHIRPETYICCIYRHGRLRNVLFAVTWKISLVSAALGFTTSPADFYAANDVAAALRDNRKTTKNA